MKLSRAVFLSGLLVAFGFAYGFATARYEVFPYPLLRDAKRLLSGSADAPPGPAVETPMENGWYEIARDPDGRSREEIREMLRAMDDVGYLDSYQAAGDEYGITVHDPERTQPGVNLIVSAHEPSAFLADLDGEVLHEWKFAFDDVPNPDGWEPPGELGKRFFRRARLLENGDLLAVYERTGLIRLDADSNLLWGLPGLYHHDLDVSPDGTIHVLTHEVRVIPRIHPTRRTFEDFVTRVSGEGEILGRLSLLEALERSRYASFLARADEDREDVFHTNTIQVLDGSLAHLSPHFREGMLLVCLWGLDVIAIVDPGAGPEEAEVVWAVSGMWHRPHEPVLLESGNLLVFDNMGHFGRSKVVELEPFTQRIVWAFEGDAENDFFSELCGSSQRLANGNTLVTESSAAAPSKWRPTGPSCGAGSARIAPGRTARASRSSWRSSAWSRASRSTG